MAIRAGFHTPAWPPFMACGPDSLRNLLAGLDESQRWPAEALARGQQAQLTQLLEWAAGEVPYYETAGWAAEKLAASKRSTDSFWDIWQSLPVLTKAALRSQGSSLHAREVPKSHLPLGKTVTSGSTGISVEVITTSLSASIWNALTVRQHLWHRRDFGKRLGSIRYFSKAARDPKGKALESWGPPVAHLHRTGPAGYIHVGYPMDVLAGWLRKFDPHYLLTYPSVAAALMDELGDSSAKPPSLEEIMLISEPVPPQLETRLREEWGVRVSEMYSANEMGYVAFRCAERGNLHVQSESVLAEILDETGRPCVAGETGRVVVTPLHNLAMPLIRYELGDFATVGEPCPCGRTLPVIRQVLGRVRNLVRTPDGRRYWPAALGKFRSMTAVRQCQYVQSAPDTIQLRLVLNRPLTEEEHGRVADLAREALGYPFQIEVKPVQEIERGPTGKFEEFLSLLPEG